MEPRDDHPAVLISGGSHSSRLGESGNRSAEETEVQGFPGTGSEGGELR